MKTNNQITYILLDKGTEDVALYDELKEFMLEHLRRTGSKKMFEKYPKLMELKNSLKLEIEVDKDK